jgi:hypothetical protein
MNVEAAVIGGLIGGAIMIALLYPARALMPDRMRMDFLLVVGSMAVPLGAAAYAAGLMMHAGFSVVFGLAHGGILEAIGVTTVAQGVAWGAALGFAHAIVVGAVMAAMPLMHPRMKPDHPKLVPALEGIASRAPDEDLLDPPGLFAMNYPPMTVLGFIMLHVIFGITVGLAYTI